ncbi:related to SEC8-protein transport protein [Sporisorium reilianum f. sp. reilianum]|uniref:Exocyst complex component Sec8 n=1 Tax=Sporisorium reilianum f. sp. reilianum TaxID=72559 RepID=A0A2N8UCP1_9BASI|nr:related to SEC8-protein transport protein [Sporisorium reilianum f. sp. reilianum]
MSNRSKTIKDLRSKIKHENTSLGSGTAASTFTSARHQVPHVGEAFGHHPGSASIGGGGGAAAAAGYGTTYDASAPNAASLGAGPSYVTLAPSDSISNYEGRQDHGYPSSSSHAYGGYSSSNSNTGVTSHGAHQHQYSQHGRPPSPTNQSTASFALDPAFSMPSGNAATVSHNRMPSRPEVSDPTPHSPLRPARSMRRPTQAPEVQRGLASITSSSTAQDRTRVPPQRPQLQIPPVGSASASRSAVSPSSPARNATGRDLLAASRSQGGSHSRNPSAQSTGAASLSPHATPPSADRHTRTAQLMAQVARSGTPSSQPDSEDHDDLYGGLSPVDAPSEGHGAELYSNHPSSHRLFVPGQRPQRDPRRKSGAPLGSLTESNQPAALDSVLSALTSAGRKRQAARIMRGTSAEEESRRRRNEKKISETSQQLRKPLTSYVDRNDPRAFQSINAVLRKVEAEWPFVANDHFNSVALALSMLDGSSLGASRFEFDQVKQLIETALQGTVDDHYESFATAITTHNSVLQSLTTAQTSVSGARRRLRDSREALGAKRADLVQMWQRSQAVKEALRLLDLVEHLKSVPDRLESLMAEKRFLESVNLLVRSLKTIDKPEVVEVGATNDLRAYLKGQEQAMLEILIEELHNHLYLKSYFCDDRWKGYTAGQDELPVVKFGSDYADITSTTEAGAPQLADSAQTSAGSSEPLQLTRFLQSLRSRPTFDPNLASDIPESALMTSTKSFSALTGELRSGSGANGAAFSAMDGGLHADLGGRPGGRYGAEFDQNPEADSFLYIEMLLESLSRLGKLGTALDIVSQRLAMEIHQLVDATIDEVDARNEPLRRFSVALRPESVLLASSSALARSFTESMRTSRSSFNISTRPASTMLRISAGETLALQRDGETMRDLFWTLFSKLDAVLQGHRVVYEVAGMIASRAGFKDETASKKLSGVGALLQVWKPIQQEVRTLLHDYLMDDEGANSARNAVISVNDVLRDHRFGRDRSKQLFKLPDAGVKRGVGKREVGPLQRHQAAVTQALKASVPGLVSSIDGGGGLGGARPGNQIIVASSAAAAAAVSSSTANAAISTTGGNGGAGRGGRGVESFSGAGHRLLVKPDAFNVSVLFQPALAFVERVAAVMPSEAAGETSRGFSAFLEEFVQDVFLPQLEDKVQTLFAGATSHSDSFAEDPASRHLGRTAASRPVVKSASNVIVLIDSLYSMLRTTPFHRESYSRLIVTTIIQYYQKCGERFRDLVSIHAEEGEEHGAGEGKGGQVGGGGAASGEAKYALSSSWAQRPEMVACLAEMRDPATSTPRRLELMAQEARFELAYAKARTAQPIAIHELTTSRKKLVALGCLQHSVEWFAANVGRLKPVVEPSSKGGSKTEDVLRAKRPKARLSVIDALALNDGRALDEPASIPTTNEADTGRSGDEELPLPLTPDLVARYPSLSAVYHALSSSLLFTLRLEIRLRIIAHLTTAISESTYVITSTAIEPAPPIVDLNAELANLDDVLSETLPAASRAFALSGMSVLIDACLIGLVHSLKAVNRDGVTKLLRNMLAVQQNLKNILPAAEVSFERCRRFYELLYAQTPAELLRGMRRFQGAYRHERGSAQVKAVGFGELQAILLLALGVENTAASKPASAMSGDKLGLVQPNAGTLGLGDVSRQKLNEYLIELHEIAGGHDSSDDE